MFSRPGSALGCGEYLRPVVLHADDDPAPPRPLADAPGEPADTRLTVVSPLPCSVVGMDEHAEEIEAVYDKVLR